MTSIRLFFLGGLLAYRALFRWLRPAIFVPTLLGIPVFQVLFFVLLGRYSGDQPDSFYAVGNAVHGAAFAGIFGATMAISNERVAGTLGVVLATPANKAVAFAGRMVPPVVTGTAIAGLMLAGCTVVFDLDIRAAALPALVGAVLACATAASAFGLMLGAVGLRLRDVVFLSNLAVYLMLLLCGTNVPVDRLPPPLRVLSEILPVTHGLAAARAAVAGRPAGGQLGLELAVAGAYLVLALVLLRVFERSSLRHATLEWV
jgi:ABC-2 type transport system permease protein